MFFKIIANIIILYCVLSVTRTQSTTPPVITENGADIELPTTVDYTVINVLKVTRTQSTTPPVITENGAIIGLQTKLDNTFINVFKGIPYAKPPIGDLRFRKTEPAINYNQTYIANNYGPQCMQEGVPGLPVTGLSEDCLYLNVWTPTLYTSANLSVMVRIYSGELIDYEAINYDMSYLAQRNVVVVSFNYRVGIFGFLYGNSSEAPGNAGLWDQVMALNWTRRNIANFGGNPNDITLFGESTGTNYVSDLIVSNNSYGVRDWFNKAILLSGKTFSQRNHDTQYAYNLARIFARNAFLDPQCNDDNEWIKCLRDKPVPDLLATGILDVTVYGDYYSLLPYSPYSALKLGYFRRDLKLMMNRNDLERNSRPECDAVMFGSYITKWQSLYSNQFTGRVYQTKFTYSYYEIYKLFNAMIYPDLNHLDDRILIFGQTFAAVIIDKTAKLMSKIINDLFTHFAKTGEALLLNPIVYGDWPPYSVSNGYVNVSYVELNPYSTYLGRVYTDKYNLNADYKRDSFTSNNNYICFNYFVEDSLNTFNKEPSIPLVITENGAFNGLATTIHGKIFNFFKVIPFARPPNIRREPFTKNLYMNGTHVATIKRPDCMRPGVSGLDKPGITNECLYVNVWTPTLNTSANLSVMVWIYSWSIVNNLPNNRYKTPGSQYFPHISYDGINLVNRNVVLVTLYYDVLGNGFNGEVSMTANGWVNGDSIKELVLNWTRRNIANFGGNSNDITLFGERHGSTSINRLIVDNYVFGQSTTPPVITENGVFIGLKTTLNHTTVNVFKGIPYAKPPIGDLRFRKTEPAINKSAYYVTTEYAPHCMQSAGLEFRNFPQIFQKKYSKISEDCLYLNVWTPTLNTSANLSVMVWINGGVILTGSPDTYTTENYNMSYLVQRNVVVVSVNYRLGVFGFLYGNSSEAPGNAGLWDQVMALNWTRRNIANFGGNPNDITLFGSSAGSISISQLIVSNASLGIRNWFNKAILLSGSAFVDLATYNSGDEYLFARKYATNAFIDETCKQPNRWIGWIELLKEKTGSVYDEYVENKDRIDRFCANNAINHTCRDDNTWIDCLRKKSASDLLIAQVKYLRINGNLKFQPIFGDVFSLIPYSPNSAVKNGYFRQDLNILLNHNEMEGEYFTKFTSIIDSRYSFDDPNQVPINKSIATDVLNLLFKNYAFKQQVVNAFVEPFSCSEINPQLIRRAVVYAFGDFIIACPTVLFGAYISKWKSFTGSVYQTRFTYQSSSLNSKIWSNATHLEDITFLFIQQFITEREYKTKITEYNGPQYNSNDKLIGNKMMDLVTHFAKTGEVVLLNPSVYNSWPPYSVSNGYVNVSYIELNPDPTRLGRVYTDRYRGNDGYTPKDINNCFNFWDKYFK